WQIECLPETSFCNTSFFFSSRRRHTRFSRDWSSDVCSSDLPRKWYINRLDLLPRFVEKIIEQEKLVALDSEMLPYFIVALASEEIGRASCRERVSMSAVGRSV